MWKSIMRVGVLLVSAWISVGCGWQLANQSVIGQQFQTLRLHSSEPYDFLTREVRQQLRSHNVTLVDRGKFPELRIKNSAISSDVVSVFKQGREAENVLTFNLNATVYIPGRGEFPVNVSNSRTFFDDSRAALAKSAEKEVIYNDMRRQAAKQLMVKLVSLQQQLAQ